MADFTTLVDKDGTEFKIKDGDVGDLSSLMTTEKGSIVGAMNELAGKVPEGAVSILDIENLFS